MGVFLNVKNLIFGVIDIKILILTFNKLLSISLSLLRNDSYRVYTAGLESTTLILLVFLILLALLLLAELEDAGEKNCVDILSLVFSAGLVGSPILIILGQCCKHFVKKGFVTPIMYPGGVVFLAENSLNSVL